MNRRLENIDTLYMVADVVKRFDLRTGLLRLSSLKLGC